MKFFLLALSFAVAIYATCDFNGATTCASTYASCTNGQSEPAVICTCYGAYGPCLASSGCLTGQQGMAYQTACLAANCTSAQCATSLGTSTVASFFVVALGIVVAIF